jgi:TRAP-type C4-dicarboxylate transport system substrate-binding protein
VLAFANVSPYIVQTSPAAGPIKVLADWKGKKMRTLGGPPTDGVTLLGGAPLYVPMGDVYTAVERGTLDGGNFVWEVVVSWAFAEIMQYFTEVNVNSGTQPIIMNLDSFNSLPQDIQDAIMSVAGAKGSEFLGRESMDNVRGPALEVLKEFEGKGYGPYEVYTPPQEEIDLWIATGGKPVWDKWVTDMLANGYPEAQDMIDAINKFSKEYP